MPHDKLALIIEDDINAAEALAMLLSDWGAEVVHAARADAAGEALKGRLAQVRWIITDYDLGPSPKGVAQARALTAEAPNARVLVLTGSGGAPAQRDAAEAGYEIMQKPAPAKAILAWLERA
jgi:DNA-binding NtrC family response regulator